MIRILTLSLLLAAPAAAQTPPDYQDDRSGPGRTVESLYNALDRGEYLRAHSYFDPTTAPDYETFRDGYADTAAVDLRIGEVVSEGAAGTIHSSVPVAIQATATDGTVSVFQGCYIISQTQPAAQETPPFRPIAIDSGTLEPTDQPFDAAMGTCDP